MKIRNIAQMLVCAVVAALLSTTISAASTLKDWMGGPVPNPETYTTVNGLAEPIFVFYPPGANDGTARPALVWIHGGGWSAGNAPQFFPNARYFASRGTVDFSIGYRLMGTTGKSISDCLDDCRSAVRYIRENAKRFGIDPNRLIVLGDSAGGHLAAALGTIQESPASEIAANGQKYSSTPDAMVLYNPITDFVIYDTQWFGTSLLNAPGYGKPISDATQEEIDHAKAISPIFNIRKGDPPALLMHGLADTVVNPDQSRRFAAAMRKAGNRCDLILVPGAQHAFALAGYSTPDSIVVGTMISTDKFLQSLGYLQGPATIEMPTAPAPGQ